MIAHPLIGVLFHWLGGLASASFYIPYRGVRKWSWETYWLAGGFFSWLIAPWLFALVMTRGLFTVLHQTPWSTLGETYMYGAMWGLGGLTFGLTMRYLGISLGMAIALGFCSAFGTLLPPIFNGVVLTTFDTQSGMVILLGVLVCLGGIGVSGAAGITKEHEMDEAQKRAVIKEFNFKKGVLIAVFSGVMSSCFAYGLNAGVEMNSLSEAQGNEPLWAGLPRLVVVLAGGFTTNFIWCLILHFRNKTGGQYFSSAEIKSEASGLPIIETAIDAPAEEMTREAHLAVPPTTRVPLGLNYFLCAIGGTCWYLQFFFYSMGESQMGNYKFSSWTLHMASIIIFSTLWGLALREWRGASGKAMTLLFLSLFVLVASTVIIGWGNYLAVK